MKALSLTQQDILTTLEANFTERDKDKMFKIVKSIFGNTVTDKDIQIAIDSFAPKGWVKIEDVKKGDYFKRKPEHNKVYVRQDYNRSDKKYSANDFDDISDFKHFKKDTLVFIDFEF